MEKRKRYSRITKLTVYLLIVSFVLPPQLSTSADNNKIKQIESQINAKSSNVKNLENQAAQYEDRIKQLKSQSQSLQNEVDLFDAQTAQLEVDIQATQAKIEELNLEIEKLLEQITLKEAEIEKEKVILKDLIRQINDYDKETMFEILLKSEEISSFFNEAEYVNVVGAKIKSSLDAVKTAKEDLVSQREQAELKKKELVDLEADIKMKRDALVAERAAKQELLDATLGSEEKFQSLLSNTREERNSILGDINNLMSEKQAEIAKISAESNRPATAASTVWYFSQNDPRWKNDSIGVSNSTINDYGCALTSVAMVFRYHGIDINPKVLARQPIFVRDLISWPTQWRFLNLDYNSSHKSGGLEQSDWSRIDQEIAAGNPVIVFIRALGRNAGHYVVIHSKDAHGYVVHDPVMWNGESGANVYLSTTRKYLETVYRTNTVVDQVIVYK
ncbi:MAG: C39 family peptidase [Patescibacteria group bacterium]